MVQMVRKLLLTAAVGAVMCSPVEATFGMAVPWAAAQDAGRSLGTFRDWDAVVRTTRQMGKQCYILSTPKKKQASKRNAVRGDIYITVTERPKFKVEDEISVQMGYPLRAGSEVRASIDGRENFRLFTEGQGAWTYDGDEDRMVAALKRGTTLTVTGVSSRGTNTTDTYSLRGFTAAYGAARKECA